MDILNKLASQSEQAEVVYIQSESTTVGFESNRLKASQVEETRGVSVRVVKDGRLGFAASSAVSSAASTTDSGAKRLVENAIESAAFGDRIPLQFPEPQPAPEVTTHDETITGLPVSRLVEIGQEIVDYLLQIEPDARINVDLERGVQKLALQNQTGVKVAFERSPLSIMTLVSRVQDDDVLLAFDYAGTTIWKDDYLDSVHRLGEKLRLAKTSATMRSGKMPVLFAPNGALVLALPLMLGLSGKNVYTGISPMGSRVGDKLFDDKLAIFDDPTLDGRFGSARYDDEGVPHRPNTLVSQGVVEGFLYDLKTAALSGVESTGNGSRSLFTPPAPAPTNLVFEPGKTSVAEMISSIDEGLWVEDVLGLGQGNIISGAFSNSLSLAYKIEKGEIVGRVKDVSIAGNVYELLQNISAISQETEWVYGAYSLPHILLPEMNVVAKV